MARAPAYTPHERRLVGRLRTPESVQQWLNGLPYNWERQGPTVRSFRAVVRHGSAHCLEAALAAAALLEPHGYPPLLLDITSVDRLDHVIYVYWEHGRWGAIARSRCVGLHGRRPVFATLPDLVRSYMAPFVDQTGRVTGYGVLDLRSLPDGRWRTATRNVRMVEDRLNAHRHHRLRMPDAEYAYWKRRFDAWRQRAGRPAHAWPTYYAKAAWSALPPADSS